MSLESTDTIHKGYEKHLNAYTLEELEEKKEFLIKKLDQLIDLHDHEEDE